MLARRLTPRASKALLSPVGARSSKAVWSTTRKVSSIPAMATASTISLSTTDSGVLGLDLSPDSARTATQVLQRDMEKHHIFFNDSGFHNHITHHVLSVYALGAPAKDIQYAYDTGSTYQRPAQPADDTVVDNLKDREYFKGRSGKRDQYTNFLAFFQREIDSKGTGPVINEYLFAGDEFSDDMLVRLFGGVLHPFIHLGFGLEFNQPAVVAQALAQTAVHEALLTDFLFPAEKAAGGIAQPGSKTLLALQTEMREDPKVKKSAHWEDPNKIFDGVMKRAPEETIRYVSQFSVGPDQVDQKLAELINAAVYFTGASQNPQKKIKFDFFYMHSLNSAIFLPTFLAQPWLSTQNKIRLLEWKGRMDLLVYVSRGSADPWPRDITNYTAKKSWDEVFARVSSLEKDDGHAAKFIRLLAYGERACKPFEGKDGFPVTGEMWPKLANMLIDSVSNPDEERWVRSAGFPEAWEDIPERARL